MLLELIKKVPNWENQTAEQLAQAINAKTIRREDRELYTYAGIVDKLGMESGFAFRATLRGLADLSNPAGLPQALFEAVNLAHERLMTGGIDFSRQDVQDLLDAVAAVPDLAPFVPTIKAIGVRYESLASQVGMGDATVAEVATALDQLTPQPDDVVAKQILLSVNSQIDGGLSASATVIKVTTRNGEVIRTSVPQVIVNGPLLDLVAPVVEALRNG